MSHASDTTDSLTIWEFEDYAEVACCYQGADGVIEIPSKFNEKPVTMICTNAFSGCSNISSIIIPDCITIIGDSAFSGCSGLSSIIIPNGVSCIESSTFNKCSNLSSVTIPDSVLCIEPYAFSGCSGLTSITIPDSVTEIGCDAFSGCSSLISITIPNKITNIERNAFSGCSSLTNISIPNSVTEIESNAFSGCSSLTNISIPNSVTEIESSAFSDCSSLTNISIPNSVTAIKGEVFSGCSSIASVTIPDSITYIGYDAFSNCSNLTSITILNSESSIDINAFSNCNSALVIYGYKYTAAESFAKEQNIKFESLGEIKDQKFHLKRGKLYDFFRDYYDKGGAVSIIVIILHSIIGLAGFFVICACVDGVFRDAKKLRKEKKTGSVFSIFYCSIFIAVILSRHTHFIQTISCFFIPGFCFKFGDLSRILVCLTPSLLSFAVDLFISHFSIMIQGQLHEAFIGIGGSLFVLEVILLIVLIPCVLHIIKLIIIGQIHEYVKFSLFVLLITLSGSTPLLFLLVWCLVLLPFGFFALLTKGAGSASPQQETENTNSTVKEPYVLLKEPFVQIGSMYSSINNQNYILKWQGHSLLLVDPSGYSISVVDTEHGGLTLIDEYGAKYRKV